MEQVNDSDQVDLHYHPIPTIRKFHKSGARIRCIVGPVGSAKTTGAAWEIFYNLPWFLFREFGYKKTKWVIVRNTYSELVDTTQATVFQWFDWGKYKSQAKEYLLEYPNGPFVHALFRSCDNPKDVKKFKSLEITGYWIDESIEVAGEIKRMLKNRIGRFPKKAKRKYGIETTNPPDIEHETYSQFDWGDTPPPGPIPSKAPLKNHRGFWQPPYENKANLGEGYYEDLIEDYRDNPDWIEMYVEGKPGVIVKGKLVYHNFSRRKHEAKSPLIWTGGPMIFGWDNSGNVPACIVLQVPRRNHVQVLREYNHDKKGIVDFTNWVMKDAAERWPGAHITHWADPAGEAQYSTRDGGFTSNALLMKDECGVTVLASDQNLTARIQAVDKFLGMEDGMLIDPSCTRLLNGMIGGYCYPELTGQPGEYGDNPIKNRYAHIQDALQYVMVKIALEDHQAAFSKDLLERCAA